MFSKNMNSLQAAKTSKWIKSWNEGNHEERVDQENACFN